MGLGNSREECIISMYVGMSICSINVPSTFTISEKCTFFNCSFISKSLIAAASTNFFTVGRF